MTITLLAVNGMLICDPELSPDIQKTGGIFVREDRADTHYRLWSTSDRHLGMIRVNGGGTRVDVETWWLPLASFAALLMSGPAGLTTGKIKLADGSEALGVLAESWLTESQREITELGSWRKYTGHFYAM